MVNLLLLGEFFRRCVGRVEYFILDTVIVVIDVVIVVSIYMSIAFTVLFELKYINSVYSFRVSI